MVKYTLYRLCLLIPLLFVLSILTFLYIQLIPGDPVAGMLGPGGSPQLVAQLRHQFGLDQSIPSQYWHWLSNLLAHGRLGTSFITRQPITPVLINRIPATIQLTVTGLIFTVLLGWLGGFLAGAFKDTWIDRTLSGLTLVGLSTPMFWIGTILILVFAVHLRWFPAGGYVALNVDPVQSIRDSLMPGLAMGLGLAPYLARMTRAATVEVQHEPFLRHARAKGLRGRTILVRYAARNAVPPTVVVIGLQVGSLLGGQVIVEQLFNWPGLSRLLIQGAVQRDYYMVQAVILVIAALYILLNLAAELAHAALDSRIRL
ncbi:MAG: peptide/nickel transport system permease protein [Pseudonocardiales bacterium]|jgi:peptide/nickel transport system permease protein|nr:peptide/nickel transport system permease protein [Pseudonocardiales bacterium]